MYRNEEGNTVIESRIWLDWQANTMLGMSPTLVKVVEPLGDSTRHGVAGISRVAISYVGLT